MRGLFTLVFAASGAAALIYEVTWTRLLGLQLGHGVAAASTVLAAFMGGLAIGSAAGGRVGARLDRTRALRVYASLEIAIALLALLLPLELRAVNPLLAFAYADGAGGAVFGFLRFLASVLLLAIPAAAMGATFPVASQWFVQGAGAAARDAGLLYAANTVGAALGALLAGFILLPFMGLLGATSVAVGLNAVAAAGAFAISRSPVPAAIPASKATSARRETSNPRRRRKAPNAVTSKASPSRREAPNPTLAAIAMGISGFASLTLQVVWTRLLALILGPTTYAFSIMVAIFIAGLAIGAAITSRFATRVRQPLTALAVSIALSAGLAAAAAALVDRGLLAVAEIVAQPTATFGTVLSRQALLAIGLLAPMTLAFGAAFPFAVAASTSNDDDVASDLGIIYAVNTAGAIAGAILAGFVFIPAAGLHGTLRIVIIVGALGSLGLMFAAHARRAARVIGAGLAVVVLAAGIFLPPWDRLLLSSGAYKYAAVMQGPDVRTSLTAGELLYYREGASATVAVRRAGGTTSLAIDGKVDASNSGDMLTQRLLAHVPLLLHPAPKRIAILGLGSGVTLGSALTHPIDQADVLEISPQVVEASRHFASENHNAIDDRRTRLILGDGRTHLLLTDKKYDVIVSEPSNPWMAGIATLFTREFFAAAKDRLAPGGVLCQWAHTYDISTRDLQSIVATFLSVFPDGALWLVGDGDVLLIGSSAPIEPLLDGVERAWQRPVAKDDLASVGAKHPYEVLSMFIAQGSRLAQWAAGAPVQSDNRAALEFSGPQSIFGQTNADNASLLRALAASAPRPRAVQAAVDQASPAMHRDRGWMLLNADAYRPAFDDFVKALEADPTDTRALDGLIRAAAPMQRTGEARALLTRLAADPARTETKLALSRLLAAEGAYDEAASIAFNLAQADSSNAAALEQLASVLSDVNDIERMRPVVSRLRAVAPDSEAAHYYSAALLFMENRVDLALAEARRVLAANPVHAKAHNLVGACLASLGQRDQARTAFRASLEADPKDPATYTNLATLEMQAGNPQLATRYFAEALTIDPRSGAARQGLAELQNR
jgi:spermidine synthase